MECIEARALKSSFLSEKSTHLHQGAFFDEFWCVTGINNVVNSEDFSVDDLLDLSDKDFVVKNNESSFQNYSEEDEEKDSISVSSRDNDVNSNSSSFYGDGFFDPLPAGELIVPAEDEMENLEWLSQIVDDSVTEEMSLLFPAATFKNKTGRTATNRFIPVPRPAAIEYSVLGFSYPVPRKARSQLSRISRRVWPIGSFSLMDSSSASSSSYDSSVTSPVIFTNPVQVMDSFWAFGKPPVKKQKKNRSTEAGESVISGSQMQRRCSHCLVQKTPQWRTGPLGPKTLCNACGVRFKSGRLFPEYRPACSPTFSVEAHSNSHRKVLEMRRKKEGSEMGSLMMSEPGLAPMVQSF